MKATFARNNAKIGRKCQSWLDRLLAELTPLLSGIDWAAKRI
jgi:hypothetical protein